MANDEWETPQELFDNINKHFQFDLDVCASNTNHKVDQFYTKEDNALEQEWGGICWMNPPYSKPNLRLFTEKAMKESIRKNTKVVCLLPVDVSTKWFQNYCLNFIVTDMIFFLSGRVRFEVNGKKGGTPTFSSCIVVFGNSWPSEGIKFYNCNNNFSRFWQLSE